VGASGRLCWPHFNACTRFDANFRLLFNFSSPLISFGSTQTSRKLPGNVAQTGHKSYYYYYTATRRRRRRRRRRRQWAAAAAGGGKLGNFHACISRGERKREEKALLVSVGSRAQTLHTNESSPKFLKAPFKDAKSLRAKDSLSLTLSHF